MATAKIKDQPHFVGAHYTASAIKPSLGLHSFPTIWEQLQTTITLPPAPTTSDSLSQREQSCHAQQDGKGKNTESSRKGMPEQGMLLLPVVGQGKGGAEPSAEHRLLSDTYTFLSLSNIPFMVSMARVAASCVSKWTKP